MQNPMLVDAVAYLGGIFLMLSLLPQVILSARTRKTDDLSWGMLGCTVTSGVFYEIYAIMLGLTPVIIMNGIFLMLAVVLSGLKARFDRRS